MFQEIMKDKAQDTPRCPFCNDENIGLHDVDPKEKVESILNYEIDEIFSQRDIQTPLLQQFCPINTKEVSNKPKLGKVDSILKPRLKRWGIFYSIFTLGSNKTSSDRSDEIRLW